MAFAPPHPIPHPEPLAYKIQVSGGARALSLHLLPFLSLTDLFPLLLKSVPFSNNALSFSESHSRKGEVNACSYPAQLKAGST